MPDPRKIQVSLVGFMDKYGVAAFTSELWRLLLSAQETVGGVPAEFIEAKKRELEQQQLNMPQGSMDDMMRQRREMMDGQGGPGRMVSSFRLFIIAYVPG